MNKIYIKLNKLQKGILYDSLKSDNPTLYLTQIIIDFKETVDKENLIWSWKRIISRYDALRLILTESEHFELLKEVEFTLEEYDLSLDDDQELTFEKIKNNNLNKKNNIFESPLMRFFLFKMKNDHFRLIWIHHHIILDATSFTKILQDFFNIYDGCHEDSVCSNQKITSYIDPVVPQMTWEYWKGIMKNYMTPSYVASLGSRSREVARPKKTYEFVLDTAITNTLRLQSSNHKVTLNSLLHASWGITLMRYLGVNDILWGEVRAFPKTMTMNKSGLFINTLPLRGELKYYRVLDFILDIRDQQKEFKNYHSVSLNEIQEYSGLSGTVLFDTAIDFKIGTINQHLFKDSINPSRRDVNFAVDTGYPMLLELVDKGDEVWARLNFNPSLFEVEFIEAWITNYLSILERLSVSLETSMHKLVNLNDLEKRKILSLGNNTKKKLKNKQYLHELVVDAIFHYPEKIAISSARGEITYKELDEKSNRIAHCLRIKDVRPNELVAIVMEKGWEEVVGTLAVLRSGAAYLPISAEFPQERIYQLLEQGEVRCVLTQSKFLKKIIWPHSINCFAVDDKEFWMNYSTNKLENIQKLTDLAYVIFTSGSTGKPKGVMIDHLGAVNTIQDINTRFSVSSEDVVLGLSALNFDLSVYDIFGCLAAGGLLVLPGDEDKKNPASWVELFLINNCTIWNSVPALMQMFVEYLEGETNLTDLQGGLQKLRLVLLSGDWLPLSLPKKIRNIFGKKTLVNSLGGATEASIWSIIYPIDKISSHWLSIPYGKPMWNQKFYILNENLQPVPQGAIAELYIGGVGVAKGYWKDAERTEKSFIYHKELGHIYKTGDLGRYLADGNIEFLGRLDHQVKLRGHRIELGEIEAVVSSLPNIVHTLVVLYEVDQKNQYLVCYYISSNTINSNDIKKYLQQKLPDYMIPSFFVELSTLPLSVNGKVERKLLPTPDFKSKERKIIIPQSNLQKELLNIWIEVLNTYEISIDDNFFEIGGHSLKAVQVISRIKRKINCDLQVKEFFKYATIELLANYLESNLSPNKIENVIQKRKESIVPVSPAQKRIWFLSQMTPEIPFHNITLCYHVADKVNVSALQHAFEKVVKKHSVFRSIFSQNDEGIWQHILSLDGMTLKIDHREANSENQIQDLVHQESLSQFNLNTPPLIKVMLISCAANSVLVITVHHIVFDAWSIKLLIDDLAYYYNNQDNSNTLISVELHNELQYADYAFWQNQEKISQEDLIYWKKELAGEIPYLHLPIMKTRPPLQTYRGKTKYFNITGEIEEKLSDFCKEKNITKSSVLLSVFFTLLYRYSSQEDLLIGMPVSQRNQAELEKIIGCFLNTLVIRSTVNEGSTLNELQEFIQNKILHAMAHQTLPYEKLVESLENVDRFTDRNALFQIMFSYNVSDNLTAKFNDAALIELPVYYETSKFDLTFFVFDSGDKISKMAFEYNLDLFDDAAINLLIMHYLNLLDAMLTNPNQAISELSILSEIEENKLIDFNKTEKKLENNLYLHTLTDEAIKKYPQKLAVISSRGSITYENLHLKANQIGHCLRKYNVRPNQLVGIVMEKGWEEVVACLGILRSGGAYLPINADLPLQRIHQLIEQGEVTCILTQRKYHNKLLWPENINVFSVDDDDIWSDYSTENLASVQSLTDLAYVIFTSGSTGKPKGVMIDHVGVVNTIQDINTRFNVTSQDTILGLSALNFDLSVYDIFGCLAVGATLILPSEQDKKDPSVWLKLCLDYHVSIWNSVPALMQMFVEYIKSRDALDYSLSLVLLSGDWLPISLPEQIKNIFGANVKINSLGGATEASIWSIIYPISNLDPTWRSIPYGKPMWNQKFYILNNQGQHVPIGVPGDLYIGGKGVAKGYWRDDEKTLKSFIQHPVLGRIYKTGDLGRFLPDNNIEFLGRRDHQVKIRGHRIEIGEIEAAILEFPVIENVLVVTNEIGDSKQLVAYLTILDELEVESLKSYLEEKLPEYMIPVAFIILKEMPLSENGKIDIKALPKPSFENINIEKYEPPTTPIQTTLAEIWKMLLNHKKISLKDNFFKLGGHSLLATQMLVEIKKYFGVEIPLKIIFQAKDFKEIAFKVENLIFENENDDGKMYYI